MLFVCFPNVVCRFYFDQIVQVVGMVLQLVFDLHTGNGVARCGGMCTESQNAVNWEQNGVYFSTVA